MKTPQIKLLKKEQNQHLQTLMKGN